ncbi:sulfite exporter TauE/SafE family protein [Vibrio sp. SCSIO 43136]|uniref:sulfite exporter TauE/SafE family protein n=1 Tax=Vibrio sp. SCSIO 43136 TaxID=2819101 RepID=UPI002075623D|nr:sulfite exporter TauE/SafE family protein [Vibrio sp. SCSIO 43136]USD66551.1 sulfite exporter TauE/SafE family protein [Vibrio sp. SCSIO 43136]
MNIDWLGAFLVGMLGAGHCLGMCGGIASAVSMGNPSARSTFAVTIGYNLGRILAYFVAGAVIGGAMSSLAQLANVNSTLALLRLVAGIFMILLALYIGRWWHGLLAIEKLGQHVWTKISPAGKKLLPLKSPLHAIPFGFIWGWLPCGLVYSTLTWSAVSGSALNGGLIMVAFGLGTLPSLLLVAMGANKLQKLQQSVLFRQIGAVLLLIYGLYTIYDAVGLFY